MEYTAHKSSVIIQPCENYDPGKLKDALGRIFDLSPRWASLISKDSRILVKVNNESYSPAGGCNTTNPVFLQTLLKYLLAKNCRPFVGHGQTNKIIDFDPFMDSEIAGICQELNVPFINFDKHAFVKMPIKKPFRGTYLYTKFLSESDAIISMPKLKTHVLTGMTGAIKDTYGFLPCGTRLMYHHKFLRSSDFSKLLAAVLSGVPQHMIIMDAIEAMEGDGPSSGLCRKFGYIFSGEDPVAIDTVSSLVAGIPKNNIPMLGIASNAGLGCDNMKRISILGLEKCPDTASPPFKAPTVSLFNKLYRRYAPSILGKVVQMIKTNYPKIDRDICNNCEECVNICPMNCIKSGPKTPVISRRNCSLCYACYLNCPYNAIYKSRRLKK